MMGFLQAALPLALLAGGACALEDFYLPEPEEMNITETDFSWGYNPWMPEYSYASADPTKEWFVLQAGGCLPEEEGGSLTGDIAPGWWRTCAKLGMNCQCRPIISASKWNVENKPDKKVIFQGMHHCSWEIRRTLDEHRRGLIKLLGISARCSMRNPEIYEEARELGVPVFVTGMNPPKPGQSEYGLPEPDGFIGFDEELYGRTMAKVLKQLLPQGGTYGFVMQWNGDTNNRHRDGFNEEMIPRLSDDKEASVWKEVHSYPYEHPYDHSVPCNHLTCQMEGLVSNRSVDALVFLFESPIRNSKYMEWVDANRYRNLTLISKGSGELGLGFLNRGYLRGLVSVIYYEFGVKSAEVLYDTAQRLARGEQVFPLENKFFETQTLSHSVIPTDLDKTHPPQLEQNLLGNLVYVGYIGFGVVVVSAIACMIWTITNRSAIVVRSAQPFFLIILASGTIIFASTVIPLSLDDGGDPDSVSERFTVGICMSQPWLAFTGFAVIFSALFSKTWRVNRLFHKERSHSRVQVSHKDVLGPFAVIFTGNFVVLTCWTAIDPLTHQRLVGDATDLWNREIESYGACRSDKALAFLIPLGLINFTVLGIACWQAFEARNIQSAFSESKYIALSVASLFQAFVTGFPMLVIMKDEPKALYMVLTLMLLVLSEGILLLVFLPKMYRAYQFSKMSQAEQMKMVSEQITKSNKKGASTNSSASIGRASKYYRAMAEDARAALESSKSINESRANVHSDGDLDMDPDDELTKSVKDPKVTFDGQTNGSSMMDLEPQEAAQDSSFFALVKEASMHFDKDKKDPSTSKKEDNTHSGRRTDELGVVTDL